MGQKIKNNAILNAIKDILNIEAYTDSVPNEINDKVQLSLNVNPNVNRKMDVYRDRNSAGTVYTTPTDKDFYLVFGAFSSIGGGAPAEDTMTFVDEGGTTRTIGCVSGSTDNSINLIFPQKGILLKRNTNITATVNSAGARFMICGYTQDTNIYQTMGIDGF